MTVVSDTSVISGLFIIGRLPLLHFLFEEIIIPTSVYQELLVLKDFGFDPSQIKNQSWIHIKTAQQQQKVTDLQKIVDKGEAEAIILAEETDATLLLMDDLKGRMTAQKRALTVMGLIGILIRCKEQKLINEVKPILEDLKSQAKFRISEDLETFLLKQVNEF